MHKLRQLNFYAIHKVFRLYYHACSFHSEYGVLTYWSLEKLGKLKYRLIAVRQYKPAERPSTAERYYHYKSALTASSRPSVVGLGGLQLWASLF